MAPEILANKQYKENIDVFSMGCVFYKIICQKDYQKEEFSPNKEGKFEKKIQSKKDFPNNCDQDLKNVIEVNHLHTAVAITYRELPLVGDLGHTECTLLARGGQHGLHIVGIGIPFQEPAVVGKHINAIAIVTDARYHRAKILHGGRRRA